jgi:transmembrane sensor
MIGGLIDRLAAHHRERAASRWVVVLSEPDASRHLEAYARWRAADPRNAAAYDALRRIWDAGAGVNPARFAVERPAARPPVRRTLGLGLGLAFAAALLVAGFSVVMLIRRPIPRPAVSIIAANEPSAVRLADGSLALLEGGTRLAIDPSRVRQVGLVAGSARLLIHHDPAHPFTLRSGAIEVIARGTVFDVGRTNTGLRVHLVDGLVEVRGPTTRGSLTAHATTVVLHPGETIEIGEATPRPAPTVDTTPAPILQSYWFDAVPLADIVRAANAGQPAPRLVLARAICGSLTVSGRFAIDPPQALADKLAVALNLRIASHRGEIILDCP